MAGGHTPVGECVSGTNREFRVNGVRVKEEEGVFCTDGFREIAPSTVSPRYRRLETGEVFQSELSLKHTAQRHTY